MKKLAWGCLLLTLFACGGGGGTGGTLSFAVQEIGSGKVRVGLFGEAGLRMGAGFPVGESCRR